MLVEESQGALNPDFARRSQEFASKVDMLLQCFVFDLGRAVECSASVCPRTVDTPPQLAFR